MRRLFSLQYLFVFCFLFVVCFSQQMIAQPVSQKKRVRLLLDWWPNPNHVPLFAGVSKGFFEEEGIELDIIKSFDAPQAIPFLVANQADVVLYYMPQTLRSKSKGHQFKVIGKLIDKPLQGFIFKKNLGIKSFKDLENKKIGLFPDGLTKSILKELPFKIEEKILQMDLITPLYLDMVEVITGAFFNIEPVQLAEVGVETESISFQEIGMPTYHELIFLAKDSSLKTPFQRALQKSLDYAKNQPEEAFLHYYQSNPDKTKKVLIWEKKAWNQTKEFLPSSQEMDQVIWQDLYSWLQKKRYLEKPIVLEELF